MKKSISSNQDYSGVLPFCLIVGLFSFYLSGYFEGGLNRFQGLVLGVLISFLIITLLVLIASMPRTKKEKEAKKEKLNIKPSLISNTEIIKIEENGDIIIKLSIDGS